MLRRLTAIGSFIMQCFVLVLFLLLFPPFAAGSGAVTTGDPITLARIHAASAKATKARSDHRLADEELLALGESAHDTMVLRYAVTQFEMMPEVVKRGGQLDIWCLT